MHCAELVAVHPSKHHINADKAAAFIANLSYGLPCLTCLPLLSRGGDASAPPKLGWLAPSAPLAPLQSPGPAYPPALLPLLDGEHHTDELCTRFEAGLPVLEQWLRIAGGGGDEDFGSVAIIYR